MASRRQVVVTLGGGAMAVPFAGYAQTTGKVFQIGYVGNSAPSTEKALVEGFRQGLRERGYTEGKDIVIRYRWAQGRADLFPGLIAELIALKVDVLVTAGTPAVLAAKEATASIPIVMAAQGDAVASGIVPNLARPGGNVTGLSTLYPDVEGKRIELLHEIVPKLSRLALLSNPANPFTKVILRSTQAAAEALHLQTQVFEVSTINEFENAFAAIARARPDAMTVLADRPFLISNRARIVRFAADNHLPTMHPYLEFVEEGGLIYYGPNFADMFRRAGTYIDRILKGAKPGDLPIEQPTTFELAINMKAVKALDLTIPQSILLRADRLIV